MVFKQKVTFEIVKDFIWRVPGTSEESPVQNKKFDAFMKESHLEIEP